MDMLVTVENLHTIWVRTSEGENVNLRDASDAQFHDWATLRGFSNAPTQWPLSWRIDFCNALQVMQGPLHRIVEQEEGE